MRPRRARAAATAALLVAALATLAAASDVPTTPVPLVMDKVVVTGASPRLALRLAARSSLRVALQSRL